MAVTLRHKLQVANWTLSNTKLVVLSFDSGTSYYLVQEWDRANGGKGFAFRLPSMLDRTDVVMLNGLDKDEVKALLTVPNLGVGYVDANGGLGNGEIPAQLTTPPIGWGYSYTTGGDVVITEVAATPTVEKETVAQGAAAATGNWFKRNAMYIVGGAVLIVVSIVSFKFLKKSKKK